MADGGAERETERGAAGSGDGKAVAPRMSRRAVLAGGTGMLGIGVLAGSGLGRILGGESAAPSSSGSRDGHAVRAASLPAPMYRTAPTLFPPRLQVTERGTPVSAGFVLLTPSLLPGPRGQSDAASVAAGQGQMGLLITDLRGEPVWFAPTSQMVTNLEVQTYRNKPVLTYWTGTITNGIGYGTGHVLDSSYRPLATIRAGGGLKEDLHDLTLTPQGTALITVYRKVSTNTTALGGTKDGAVFEGVVQEVDLASGKVVFQWSSLAHVPVTESYVRASGSAPIDYFHVNSVSLFDPTSLLISSRHTSTIYCVSRKTGAVLWRLGGKRSSFSIGPGANFAWQHDVRRVGTSNQLSIFDNGTNGIAPGGEAHSRALVVNLSMSARRATLARALTHPAGLLAPFEGSTQLLAQGHVFVGWGGEPYSSEFDGAGRLVLDLRFPTNDQSYRAFRSPWHATPTTPPQVVIEKDGVGGYAVYVSWNGATEVASWQVLGGVSTSKLAPVATVPKAGFETAITVHASGPYLAVAALDAAGRRLGISKPQKA